MVPASLWDRKHESGRVKIHPANNNRISQNVSQKTVRRSVNCLTPSISKQLRFSVFPHVFLKLNLVTQQKQTSKVKCLNKNGQCYHSVDCKFEYATKTTRTTENLVKVMYSCSICLPATTAT